MTRWVCLTSGVCGEGRAQRQGGCVLPQGSVMRAELNDKVGVSYPRGL